MVEGGYQQRKPIVKKKPVFIKLDAMEPGERMNVYVKVVHVSETEEIKRYDGGSIKQAIVVVGDSDGVVKLIAKNEQLDVMKEGQNLILRNAEARVVASHIRVEVDIWGKIEKSDKDLGNVNLAQDFSKTEYEPVR